MAARRPCATGTGDASALLDRVGERMDLTALDAAADARLSQGFSALGRDLRRPLLLAHLGFPFFDIATLPLLQGDGLDEFDPIRVDRISPEDARAIRTGGADPLVYAAGGFAAVRPL